jgi:hypothetical protein
MSKKHWINYSSGLFNVSCLYLICKCKSIFVIKTNWVSYTKLSNHQELKFIRNVYTNMAACMGDSNTFQHVERSLSWTVQATWEQASCNTMITLVNMLGHLLLMVVWRSWRLSCVHGDITVLERQYQQPVHVEGNGMTVPADGWDLNF